MNNCLLSIFSAILLLLCFPQANLWILAWFGFVPLFFAIRKTSKLKAFFISYLAGIVFWAGIIYWLIHVTLLGTFLLILYLASYFALFGLIFKIQQARLKNYQLLFLPAFWVSLEYIRSHLFTGFPWALLGYSQYINLPVIQIADITGAWGVSFLVMMVNAAVYLLIADGLSNQVKIRKYLVTVICVIAVLIYGQYRLNLILHSKNLTRLKISVIQANIAQDLKWDPNAKYYIFDKYVKLTEQAASDKPDLIVWPEAASPEIFGEGCEVFESILALSEKIKTPLLVGVVVKDNEDYYNSALLVSNLESIGDRYDKLHLVPFGEYIPLRRYLSFLETIVPIGEINRGKEYTVFRIANPQSKKYYEKFSVLICFEDLFPELSRNFVKRGAAFLINITNDAWYKKTNAAKQHFQASVFRAVENRAFLVRCANTGVSGFIAPSGRVISLVKDQKGTDIFISGYRTEEITPQANNRSFYTHHGDVFIIICLLLALCGIMPLPKTKK